MQRVKEVTPSHYFDHRNNQKLTAEGLFDKTNKELRQKAIEWIKRTAEGCSLVAVLIATVAFAAAYTIPGGSNGQDWCASPPQSTIFCGFYSGRRTINFICFDISGCISWNHRITISICRL